MDKRECVLCRMFHSHAVKTMTTTATAMPFTCFVSLLKFIHSAFHNLWYFGSIALSWPVTLVQHALNETKQCFNYLFHHGYDMCACVFVCLLIIVIRFGRDAEYVHSVDGPRLKPLSITIGMGTM